MKNFIKIEIETTSLEEGEMMMAQLSENNFYAFVHEDSFGEQNENVLIAYIKEEDFNEGKLKTLLPGNTIYKYSVIEDRNWNQEWESQLQPVTINNFVAIRASFHEPVNNVEHEIIITPKMSFGTGHHATTFLMVDLMEKISFKNKTVLDFGTGTGILAILAEKLGAALVIAVDYDEWSINNAFENIEANQCKHIFLEKRNNIIGLPIVNIILANINCNVLQENAKNLSMLLQPVSLLIVSGFLLKDEDAIVSVFVKNGFIKKQMSQKDGWIVLLFEKR
jgi:ribosomal protein L11 methyltransferase